MSADLQTIRALIPGNEHESRLAAIGQWPPGEYPCVRLVEAISDLLAEVEDWRDSARWAANEKCQAGDEVHCTCVGVMRKRIAELEAAITLTLADDESQPGGWGPDITMQLVLRDALLGGESA